LGEGEGIQFRHRHRERKASLSDGVAVDRIAAVDRQEEFREMTEELNREIQEHRHEAKA
jgi:glycerol-3-phosphate O-acyltransferase / dihydroxyacetone phosphate acyltransferase